MEPPRLITDDDIVWESPEGAPIGRVPRREGRDPEWYENFHAYRHWGWRDYETMFTISFLFGGTLCLLGYVLVKSIQWVWAAALRNANG